MRDRVLIRRSWLLIALHFKTTLTRALEVSQKAVKISANLWRLPLGTLAEILVHEPGMTRGELAASLCLRPPPEGEANLYDEMKIRYWTPTPKD